MAVGKWPAKTQYLVQKADAGLAELTDDSIIAQLLSKDGDVVDYTGATDSLEALSDAIGAISTVDPALASVLGTLADVAATGAVSSAKTAMSMIKQIVTMLLDGTYGLSGLQVLLAAIPTTAMRGTENAALASVVGALDTAAATGDVTTATLIMAYIKQLVNNSEILAEHITHTTAIFPEATNIDCVLTAHASANTWSSWTEIVDTTGTPVTLSSKFAANSGHISAMLIEDTDTTDTRFQIEIAYGSAKTIVSRHRILTETNKLPTAEVARERGSIIPAGETIYYRAMCETADAKTITVHFRYFLHI